MPSKKTVTLKALLEIIIVTAHLAAYGTVFTIHCDHLITACLLHSHRGPKILLDTKFLT
ncbi:MAG: hypothetical protein LBQ98_02780 [Nitrososphaerota archaeon]|nr:hypothetical protein [Nitrososphaerota archaeon]